MARSPHPFARRIGLLLRGLVGALVACVLCFGVVALSSAAEEDKGVLAGLISKALSSKTTKVSIGAVDGALSSDATISDIVLSDDDGPWLKVDKVRLVWRRLALLQRRLEVDQLQIGKLVFLRKPRPAPAGADAKADDSPILPDLPVKVIVKQFGIDQLSLGEPLAGVAARLAISGAATLGAPSEGLDLHLDAHRLDAAGAFLAQLNFVPDSKALTIALKLEEPEGGLLVHLAGIPGLPPVKFDCEGSGALDAFAATLTLDAGPTIGAAGHVDLRREGPGRELDLSLQSRIAGLLPAFAGAVFAGETSLQGKVLLRDAGGADIQDFHLTSSVARLDISGGLSDDRALDVKIHAGAIPGANSPTTAEATRIAKLEFNASVKGPWTGPQIAADLDAAGLAAPQGRLGQLTATLSAAPNGALNDSATRIALSAKAEASGLAPADRAWAAALGDRIEFSLRGDVSNEGAAQLDEFRLASPSLEAGYHGTIGPKSLHGALTLHASDLSHFAEIASVSLKGAADVTADLDGAPNRGAVSAALDARVAHFATGVGPADGFAGGQLGLKGVAQTLPNGGFGFQNLTLAGAHGSARLDGVAIADHVDIKAQVEAPDAHDLDPRVSGKAQISAALTGKLSRLDAAIHAGLLEGRLLGRAAPEVALDADILDLTGLLDAKLRLKGEIGGKALDSAIHAAKRADGGWRADQLALTLGSAALNGDLTLDAANFADGRLTFAAANLDDLSPLVLTPLAGAINAGVALTAANGRQDAHITARSPKLSVAGDTFEGFDADLTLADLRNRPILDGSATLAAAMVAGQSVQALHVSAKGSPDGSDLDFAARIRGLAVSSRARLLAQSPLRLDVSVLDVRGAGQRIALSRPTSVTFGGDGVAVDGLALAVGDGRVTIDGHAGATLDVKAAAVAVPLSVAGLAAPGLGLTGTLSANVNVGGTPADPRGDWRIQVAHMTSAATRGAALPALDATASGRLGGGRSTLEAKVDAGAAGALNASGSLPLNGGGDLDLRIQGKLNAAVANASLGASGRRMTGEAAIDVTLRGPLAKPLAAGSATLSDGGFVDVETGFRLENITARVSAKGDQVVLERLDASTPNGGSLNVKGQVRLDPSAGFPGAFHIVGQKAELAANDIVAASADLAIDASGPLAQAPNLRGRVTIVSMDIAIPEKLAGALRPLDNVKHVNPGPTAKARLAMDAMAKASAARAPPFNAKLDLVVSSPGSIAVRGRGLFAQLGGELRIGGDIVTPQVHGEFSLRQGTLAILGQRLDLTRGDVVFHGGLSPDLDFLAETSVSDITAQIAVSGPASQPKFTITSQPSLPPDEILSRILFQTATGSLTAFQALELANSVSTLSGGSDSFERVRKSLGVDSFDVGSDQNGQPTASVTRSINDRLSIGVTTGGAAEDNGVSANLNVTKHIRLQAGVDASGGTSAGVGVQWEYK